MPISWQRKYRWLRLSQIPGTLKYILWDTRAQRIISVAEYEHQMTRCAVAAVG